MILGIDASNIRDGGGVTHLVEMLKVADPNKYGFSRIIVWGGSNTLDKLDELGWLTKSQLPVLDKNLLYRFFWQWFNLPKIARAAGCTLLFIPGGTYFGNFKPFVTISQNLLPFEWFELFRYGFSTKTLKMLLLRLSQSYTFHVANGLIFLTKYAKNAVGNVINVPSDKTRIIPHGIHNRFVAPPKKQLSIQTYTSENPFKILYVSVIEMYKHQWNVAEAVSILHNAGIPVVLDLVGPAYPPALKLLKTMLAKIDPEGNVISYIGPISHADLHNKYAESDLCVFASSCENLPIILLEGMAAGLPIACSNFGPMPEILGEAGVYFNPLNSKDISIAIKKLIDNPELRAKIATLAFEKAKQYSWNKCAEDTFQFLADIAVKKSN